MKITSLIRIPEKYYNNFFFNFGFGVIAPLVCLLADPGIFKGESLLSTGGLFAAIKVFAYLAIGLGVAALAAWLLFRNRLAAYSSYLSGVFWIAQVAALLLATVLVPFSILGLAISRVGLLSLLGFIPFFTAFVFSRQRKLARSDASALPHRKRSAFLGALGVVMIPILLQWATSRYVNSAIRIILNNPDSSPIAISQIKAAFWCGDECFYELAYNYYKSYNDPARHQYLATVYHDITGGDISTKISNFSD